MPTNTSKKSKALTETQILMVGPSRVGKSSMLASISSQLKDTLEKINYVSDIPNGLVDKLQTLKDLAEGNSPIIDKNLNLTGDASETKYPLNIREKNVNYTDIHCDFIDVPGGWFSPSSPDYPKVEERLRCAAMSFWCIDAASMMYNDGKFHKTANDPATIANLFQKADVRLQDGHTIVFVLVRSEKWSRSNTNSIDDTGCIDLFKTFTKEYGDHIVKIKNAHKNVNCYVCWVETLGNVKLKMYLPDGNDVEFFRAKPEFSPRNCDTPTLLAIQQTLEDGIKQMEKKGWLSNIPIVNALTGTMYYSDVLKRFKSLKEEIEIKIKNRLDGGKLLRRC